MIASFAGIAFQVSDQRVLTFDGLTKTVAARYADHAIVGRKPKSQFLGADLATLEFSATFSASLGVNPMACIQQLEWYTEQGVTSFFVLGGMSFGRFTIRSMSEAYDIVTNAGGVAAATVDLTLKEYR